MQIASVGSFGRGSIAWVSSTALFELSRFMGTSVEQIDKTYGHLLPDALDRTRQALDVFTSADAERRIEQQ
jgi:hypothetical protein